MEILDMLTKSADDKLKEEILKKIEEEPMAMTEYEIERMFIESFRGKTFKGLLVELLLKDFGILKLYWSNICNLLKYIITLIFLPIIAPFAVYILYKAMRFKLSQIDGEE